MILLVLRPKDQIDAELDVNQVPNEVIESIGILSLNGQEKLFALDGQHRFSGDKRCCGGES